MLLTIGSCVLAERLGRVPFSGPRSGQVLDAGSGQPVAGATLEGIWTCYDSPIPLSHQSRSVYARATTGADGRFTLARPGGRRGMMDTEFVFRVRAEGYIEAVFILDPSATPLPAQTVAWPFAITTVLTAMPETMVVKLKPALPVLTKAAKSPQQLVRRTAREELTKLSRGARPELRRAAAEALKKIGDDTD